ncbi:unnamed protein product [Trifolium pratense]|uniref:Uncharacterized protein n=1 Tax=Trifolium pratense TaxID=57577 RepID=A0ACB0LA25_TRIPR|nr:unnamed protein product [Trifolium pratense]
MNKVYTFVYAMIIFFSKFISITNGSAFLCLQNEHCQDLDFECIPPKVPNCLYGEVSDVEFGFCECSEKITVHNISGF